MKKLLLFVVAALLSFQVASAQKVWTLKTIPNPHERDYFKHVSDPDYILSDSTKLYINKTVHSIVKKANIYVVVLGSIGNEDTQEFRNKLFNYWKVGERTKNNGLLMLFVKDQRKMEFETGYGLEGVLTDVDCFAIYNQFMKPYFKEGDYDTGMYIGVTKIVNKLGADIDDPEPSEEEIDWLYIIGCSTLFLCCVKWFFDILYFLFSSKQKRKEIIKDGMTYNLFMWPFRKAREKEKLGFKDVLQFFGRFVIAIIGVILVQVFGMLAIATSRGGSSGSSGGGGSSGGSSGGGGYSGSW